MFLNPISELTQPSFKLTELKKIDMNTKMYVGNLPFTATEDDVRALFTDYGTVTDIHLPMDRDSGRPRGFAFVTMDSQTAMNEAIRGLNEKDYGGRNLTINEARPKEDRPAGGGGYGGGGGGGGGGRGGYGGGGGGGKRGGGGFDRGSRGGDGGGEGW